MAEEIKNQTVNDKKRTITEKLPEKLAKKYQEKKELRAKRSQEFYRLSLGIVKAEKRQQDLLKEFQSVEDSIKEVLERGAKKLRLRQRKEYNWRFDGRDSFIGIYNLPKPKKVEEKK